jgi:phosphoglycerate-specific signal transduction histidine kinase
MSEREAAAVVGRSGPAATRFGIKFKLFAAFLGLVALTAIAGLVAVVVFDETDQAIHHLVDERLPEMTAALRLAETSAQIAAAAPAIAASTSQAERMKAKASVDAGRQQLDALADSLLT